MAISIARILSQLRIPITAKMGGVGVTNISGLIISWNSGTSISVSAGSAYIPSLAGPVVVDTPLTLSGLTLTAATWYHVYLYDNAGTAAIEAVTTAPAAPYAGAARTKTGDATRRYLGSLKTADGSSAFMKVKFTTQGRVQYQVHAGAAPLQIYNATPGAASFTVSSAGVVPVTATHVEAGLISTHTGASLYIGNSDLGTVSQTNYLSGNVTPCNFFGIFAIDSAQNFSCIYSNTPTSALIIRVSSYLYER